MTPYLVVFGVSAGVAFLTTPLVRRLAIRVGAIAQPADRKVHLEPTPTMGGLAMFAGILAGLGVARFLPFFGELYGTTSDPLAALVGVSAIMVVGVVDDLRGIRALTKLTGQIFAAGLTILAGVQLLYFWFPGQGVLSLSPDLAVPLSILWIVAAVNAVNLIDGLDGLAAGMVAIASISFFAYMYRSPGVAGGDASGAALLSAIAAGVSIGFLPWNFNPARIFMGDSGAMLLGMLLSVATISGVGRTADPPTGGDLAAIAIPIAIPLLVLAIPLLDVALAIARRVRRGSGIAAADKEHIHHRLLEIGHSHRRAVLLMYLWSALISGSALAVAFIDGRLIVGAIVVASLGIVLATMLPRLLAGNGRRRKRAGAPASRDGDDAGGPGGS